MQHPIRRAPAILAFAVLVFAAPAQATFPGTNGKLAFSVTQPTAGDPSLAYESRIGVANADGSGVALLTPPGTHAEAPAWSPDGSKIAYVANEPCEPPGYRSLNLHVMDADGRNDKRLTAACTLERRPAWSRDGSQIVFTHGYPWGYLSTVSAAGGSPERIFYSELTEAPDWSPVEDRIAFQLYKLVYFCEDPEDPTECYSGPGAPEINVIGADGSGLTPVTTTGFNYTPSWSPDGRKILFGLGPIYTVDADGTGVPTRVGTVTGSSPVWSPDGTKIAVEDDYDIKVLNADGTGVSTVLDGGYGAANYSYPDWQPLPNLPPDCSAVIAAPILLWPANRKFKTVELSGATDPDGDAVSLEITGVTQDEPVGGARDAQRADGGDAVRLRSERDPRGDGRLYTIAYEATDGRGGSCLGVVKASVPRHRKTAAVESAPPSYDSFGQ